MCRDLVLGSSIYPFHISTSSIQDSERDSSRRKVVKVYTRLGRRFVTSFSWSYCCGPAFWTLPLDGDSSYHGRLDFLHCSGRMGASALRCQQTTRKCVQSKAIMMPGFMRECRFLNRLLFKIRMRACSFVETISRTVSTQNAGTTRSYLAKFTRSQEMSEFLACKSWEAASFRMSSRRSRKVEQAPS